MLRLSYAWVLHMACRKETRLLIFGHVLLHDISPSAGTCCTLTIHKKPSKDVYSI